MELLPILEPEDRPRASVCVGHTCTYLPGKDAGKGKIVIVGGANPNGSFSESHIFDLDRHEWDIPEWEGLQARYEHCSFVPESSPHSLWVFGGAQQSGNRNCIQAFHIDGSGSWKSVQVTGTPPSARTYHTNSACVGDRLFVFSGGDTGATPVSDPQLHIFDTVSLKWLQPETQGKPPSARHGHVVVAVGSKLYIHGGLAGEKFHNDLYCLDTTSLKWERIRAKGDIPAGMAAHSVVSLGKSIYIFGGMTPDGASNSMYSFHTDRQRWTLLKFEGDLPPNRLDHSMCVVPWRIRTEDCGVGDQVSQTEFVNLCFIFGGMDTHGVIHSDCVATVMP
ncbi:hypothetical protein JZ751_012031 [Albula glossodonta]|uniref:Rab9 effector protein with kelch motifs n=1 Tax=Albula glossodonta TaxID=121402 RepID=A0A8T2PR94_9TELE|nr:hypothetical protein JZ751_012031 [Albula glossodonta]